MTLPFENDTGPVIKKLASRSIQTDKRRNLFVIVTIALAAALMAAIFCAGAGSDRKLEADIRGQYQAVVVNCDHDTIERLKDCPEVERWGLSQNDGSARYGDSVLTVEYADANWMELGKKPSFTGTLPQAANEILVERAFLDYFEIPAEVGQTIEVNLGNGKQTYTVSGIMDVENDSRMFQLYVSEAFVEEMAQGEPLFEFRLRYTGADSMELEQLKADIAAFLSANDVSEDQIFYSSNYFDMQGFKSGVMKYYIPVAILLLIACAVVIYSIFFISVKGKMREYGRLKVIGTTPKQIRRIVRREGLLLSLCGIPLGLLVGGAIGFAIFPAHWSWMGNLPYLAATAAACALTVFLSIHAPVRMAARVSPIEAVRSSGYETATDCKDQKNHRITPFSMAQMNFRRSRKKTVITLVSLGLTGVFLVTAATVLNSISPEKMAIEAMGDHCNYEVSWMDSGGAEGLPAIARENPLTEELRQELLAIDGVESITSHEVTSVTVKLPQESVALKFPVFDREQMEQWLPEENLEQGSADYEELAANNGVVVTDSEDHLLSMFYGYTPAVGDVLTFESMDGKAIEVTVMGIAKPSVTSGTGAWGLFTLTEELADQLYPDIENREAVWNVHTSEDSDALRAIYFQPAGKSGADGLFQSRPCGIPGIAAKDDDPRCLSAAGCGYSADRSPLL